MLRLLEEPVFSKDTSGKAIEKCLEETIGDNKKTLLRVQRSSIFQVDQISSKKIFPKLSIALRAS